MKEKKEMQIVVTADDSKAKTKLQKLADYLKNNFEEDKKTKVEVDTTSSMQKLNDYLKELETVDQKLNKVFSSGKNYQVGDVNITTSGTYLNENAKQEFDSLSAKADELREKIGEIMRPMAEGYQAEWVKSFENIDVSQTTSNLALTKAELIQINDRIASIKSSIKNIDREAMPEAFDVLARELEEAEQKAEELKIAIKDVDNSANDTSKNFSTLGDKISKALNRASKKTNKFVLSLFSIRTAWSLISKASSTYLSENESTSNKVAAAWSYLGNLVGPIIEEIVSWLQYGIAYLNVFVKALSGVDLLAKSIKNTIAKTNKELKKTVSSMDEVVNLDKDSGSSSNPASALQDISNLKLNQDIVHFLEDLASALIIVWDSAKGFWNFLEENFGTTGATMIVGGLGIILGSAAKGTFGGTGLLGISSTLNWILGIGSIGIFLYFTNDDFKEIVDNTAESVDSLITNLEELTGLDLDLSTIASDILTWVASPIILGLQALDELVEAITALKNKDWEYFKNKSSKKSYTQTQSEDWIDIQMGKKTLFASGGFPEEGQMFIANEKGPEMVGNIGSSTAVINNQQIVDSVSIGVANAVAGVLGTQKTTSQNASYIYINGSEFAKAVYNDMENESLRRNKNTSIRRA